MANRETQSEKWESMVVLPAHPDRPYHSSDYFILSINDNDFVTQDGAMAGGNLPYADSSGADIDNQFLMFKVRMPF